MSTAHRVPGLVAAGLISTALLVGCGGSEEEDAPATAASSSAEEAPGEAAESDLASGLLPAEAFGPDATVVAVPAEQLSQAGGLAAAAEGAEIQPEECRAAVEGAQPDLDAFEDVAAQSASLGAATTVEMLVRGGPLEDAVSQLEQAAERCPQAQVTIPGVGQAALTFENLPVDDLGDGAALLRYAVVVTGPDGSQTSIPTLIGAVEDGDRLLLLVTIVADPAQSGGSADPAAFTTLLEQAYETQADALG
jgi:hypothetical protein